MLLCTVLQKVDVKCVSGLYTSYRHLHLLRVQPLWVGLVWGLFVGVQVKALLNPKTKVEYIAAYQFLFVVADLVFFIFYFPLLLPVDPASESNCFSTSFRSQSCPAEVTEC